VTEDELLTAIVGAALLGGWCVHHDRRSDKALQQGTAGFPDLVLARAGRVIFAELKTERGQLTEDQLRWHLALRSGHAESYLWRPDDLDRVIRMLVSDR
jgi:hypothetical protein